MKTYNKRRPPCKPKTARNSSATDSGRREQSVYDGQRLLGILISNEKSRFILAWDAQRRFLGRFQTQREAANAISAAARAAEVRNAATAEAFEYLNRPTVEFVTGMPAHFLGRRA
jgi:hypothetical protein